MKALFLALLFLGVPQKPATPPAELTKLRDEFVKATNDYKASLAKLLTIYEGNVSRAEQRLEAAKRSVAEGNGTATTITLAEESLKSEFQKVEETKRQIANADQQIAGIFNEARLEQEYKQAVKQRRRARKPKCTNWTVTACQRQTSNSLLFGYRLVCQK